MENLFELEKTALVVIDLQKMVLGRQYFPYTAAEVVHNASRLANAFTEVGAFMILCKVAPAGKASLHPKSDMTLALPKSPDELYNFAPELDGIKNAHITTRQHWGAFYGSDIDLQLRRRGIDTIVLCGVSAGYGVDTTAREAYQHGYNQIFVEDAITAMTQEEYDYVCKHIFPPIGRLRKSDDILRSFES